MRFVILLLEILRIGCYSGEIICDKILIFFFIPDNSQIVKLLTEIGFENTADAFINNDFTIEGVMAIEKSELIELGFNIGQAKQFILSLEKYKEEDRKRGLRQVLERIERLDLFDTFVHKKIQPRELWHLSADDLAKMGISYWNRIGWSRAFNDIGK